MLCLFIYFLNIKCIYTQINIKIFITHIKTKNRQKIVRIINFSHLKYMTKRAFYNNINANHLKILFKV